MKSYDLSNVSVLVVEKHSHMRTILRQVLRQFNVANVYDASDPRTGYQRYKDCFPDIVILDWGPGFDGLKLVSKIRAGAESANPWVPVIMCTANTEKRHIVEARDAGATEYLLKPVSAKSIYSRLVSVIEDARAFIRTEDFAGPDRRRHDVPYGGEERRKENRGIVTPKPRTEEGVETDKPSAAKGGKKAKKGGKATKRESKTSQHRDDDKTASAPDPDAEPADAAAPGGQDRQEETAG